MLEEKVVEKANEYARTHKKEIASELTDVSVFPPDAEPVSVFMAGSPGAGKTESSQNLIKELARDGRSVLRIDPDELRSRFEDYTGANSHLFQGATTIVAEYMHDCALSNRQSFVFDGTLSNYEKSRENILRSLKRKRLVQIIYVYQNPLMAWEFVKARELREGRRVPKESFINQYFQARANVNRLKAEFGKDIKVDLIVKNLDGSDSLQKLNIDQIDRYIPERYSVDVLNEKLVEKS